MFLAGGGGLFLGFCVAFFLIWLGLGVFFVVVVVLFVWLFGFFFGFSICYGKIHHYTPEIFDFVGIN